MDNKILLVDFITLIGLTLYFISSLLIYIINHFMTNMEIISKANSFYFWDTLSNWGFLCCKYLRSRTIMLFLYLFYSKL